MRCVRRAASCPPEGGCALGSAGDRPQDTGLDAVADDFARLRPRLFGIAYRMLGGVADAEDIVQDVWVKWQAYDRAAVRDATAFLVTMTTRLAINATQTARARRETYVGPWLPEPVDTTADPQLGAERGEALETAVLVLLEKLSPTERAAFVLREAFDYPYARIAEVLQTKVSNARKLLSRARQAVAAERQKSVDATHQHRLLAAFLSAAQAGDFDELESPVRRGGRQLHGRRRRRPGRVAHPGVRPRARGEVHRGVRLAVLVGDAGGLGRCQRPPVRAGQRGTACRWRGSP